MTHICVSKLTIIGPDNGLWPGRRQAIIWTNVGILLITNFGTNFSEILIEIHTFSLKKLHLKMSSAKWRPSCLGLNVLTMSRIYHFKQSSIIIVPSILSFSLSLSTRLSVRVPGEPLVVDLTNLTQCLIIKPFILSNILTILILVSYCSPGKAKDQVGFFFTSKAKIYHTNDSQGYNNMVCFHQSARTRHVQNFLLARLKKIMHFHNLLI